LIAIAIFNLASFDNTLFIFLILINSLAATLCLNPANDPALLKMLYSGLSVSR
jgi:hypothetical protein